MTGGGEFYMVQHCSGRVVRGDGRLTELKWIDHAVKFNSFEAAKAWWEDTKIIPDRYKWRYFSIRRFS